MMVFGITGGLATGKSTVAAEFGRLGAAVLDADAMAREMTQPGSALLQAIVEEFGRGILRPDGSLDRGRLASLVFPEDPAAAGPSEELQRLQAIIHPAVVRRCADEIDALRRTGKVPAAVIDAPLLLEAGMRDMVDRLVVVAASEQTQLRRAASNLGIGSAQAKARIAAQMPLAEKITRADYVIDGEAPIEQMRSRVKEIWDAEVGG